MTFRLISIEDRETLPGRAFRSIRYVASATEESLTASAYEDVIKSLRQLRDAYREALAAAWDAACETRAYLDLTGVNLPRAGFHSRASLEPHFAGAVDTKRTTLKGNGGRHKWEAKAYGPDRLSFFGEAIPLGGKSAAALAHALGLPSWKEVEEQAERLWRPL